MPEERYAGMRPPKTEEERQLKHLADAFLDVQADPAVRTAWVRAAKLVGCYILARGTRPQVFEPDELRGVESDAAVALAQLIDLVHDKSPALVHAYGQKLYSVIIDNIFCQTAEQLTGRDLSRALPTSKEVYEPRRLLPDNPIPVAPDAPDLREALAKAKRGHTEQWQRYLGYLKEAVGGRPEGSTLLRNVTDDDLLQWGRELFEEKRRKRAKDPTLIEFAGKVADKIEEGFISERTLSEELKRRGMPWEKLKLAN